METRQQSHQLSDRFAAAGSKATPVPAEQQILVNTLCEVQKVCPILSAQPIGSVEELEVATDSEDAACAVSIFRGWGAVCVKIQGPAVGIIRKEAEQRCVI